MMPSRTLHLLLATVGATIVFAGLVALALSAAPPGSTPTVKQTLQASADQTRAAASSRPQPPPGPTPPPRVATLSPIVRRAAGAGYLVTDFAPPFPAMSHVITSMWYQEIGGQRTIVYAGALRDSPGLSSAAAQGIVVVQVETLAGSLRSSATFSTPTEAGPVTIESAQGERLLLQTASGATLYFDVPSRQFVSSP